MSILCTSIGFRSQNHTYDRRAWAEAFIWLHLHAPPLNVVVAHAACRTSEAILAALRGGYMQDPASELRRIPLLRRWVNSADAALKPLGASRSLRPSQARNLLPPPSLPGLRCSGQTSPLSVRRIGGVAKAGKLALASVPVTQEPYRNRDCEDWRAHSFLPR